MQASLEVVSPSSQGLDEQGVNVDKTIKHHENLWNGGQEVDICFFFFMFFYKLVLWRRVNLEKIVLHSFISV